MHTPDLLGLVKKSDIEIVQISIELSKLIVFDYGVNETQDVLRCWRNGVNYILWLTSSPFDRNSGE